MQADSRTATDAELYIDRVFEAPRELVFEAWTNRAHLDRWSCPKGFTLPVSEGDVRDGGWFRACMRSPEGQGHWVSGTYKEVRAPEKLVFTHAWEGEDGERSSETLVTVTFEAISALKTRMRFHQAFFPSRQSRDGHEGGWNQSFDKLGSLLATLVGSHKEVRR
jgi:uncharacterized protein YndB with AHSA1/START domain